MRNVKIVAAYDGTGFAGWQVQPGRRTIQGEIERVLARLEGAPVKVHGSGRTDAGVHALAQTASFRLSNPMPIANLRQALNHLLPPAIRILSAEEADPEFHARYSAREKTYEYRIWREEICPPFEARYVHHFPYPLDEEAMCAAAPLFEGTRDFRSLACRAQGREDTTRTVFRSALRREGPRIVYHVSGSGFLHNMVRNIVGTLIETGRGNIAPADIGAILEARDRSAAGATAPASGLFLATVRYGR